MDEISDIAGESLFLIEDVAKLLEEPFKVRCWEVLVTYPFSFFANKTLPVEKADGGNQSLCSKKWPRLRMVDPSMRNIFDDLGYNYRMTMRMQSDVLNLRNSKILQILKPNTTTMVIFGIISHFTVDQDLIGKHTTVYDREDFNRYKGELMRNLLAKDIELRK